MALALALSAGASPAAYAQAEDALPSVRLVASAERVTLSRYGGRVPLELGVFVASVGGDFELRASRPSYAEPPVVAQIDPASGAVVPLEARTMRGLRGLRRFFEVTVRDRAGGLVATRHAGFCPNSPARERMDDTGRIVSRYPAFCGSGFPFARGVVWGIDDGWAVGALGGGEEAAIPTPAARLAAGRYSVTVRIAPRYAALFAVAAEDAEVRLRVTVRDGMAGQREAGTAAALPRHSHTVRARAVPEAGEPDAGALPDLVALPAWSVHVQRGRKRDLLSFAASPWNAGPGPLVVEGFRRRGESVMDAYQYFHASGDAVSKVPVGTFAYDARRGHEHWHFLQFVRYALLDASGEEVLRSRKQAFCLVPTDAVDLTVPGATWTPHTSSLTSACGTPRSLWVRETLFAGWADTYFQSTPGQSFDVTGLPNGRYSILVEVNPLGALRETTTENNAALRQVTLRGRPGNRRVRVAPWQGIRE